MPNVRANGITIEYDERGNPDDPTLLLVMGLGQQLVGWDPDFCDQLAARGFRVVRFDNRDTGKSTWIEDGPVPDVMAALFQNDCSTASYTLDDMADDAVGLLDALGVGAAHVVGASMGGMIAQTIALRHPDRVLSLCSIMSTTGSLEVGQPHPEALPVLISPRPRTREEAVALWVTCLEVWGAKGMPIDWDRQRERAALTWDRGANAMGVARQLVAIRASGDRTERLPELRMPTVVIHGTDDKLVDPSGGRATAAAIPGAELVIVEGMGHDLPPAAWDTVVGAIVANAERAGVRQ